MKNTNVTIRYFLCGVNILFLITGLLVVCLALALKISFYSYGELIKFQYVYFPNFLLILGFSIFLLAYLGFYAVSRENACITLTYSTLLLLIFFIELAVGISGFVLKSTVDNILANSLSKTFSEYNDNINVKYSWDQIQEKFYCCGVHGPVDWIIDTGHPNGSLPQSCCTFLPYFVKESDSLQCNINSHGLHKNGCLSVFGNFLKTNSFAIEVIGISLAMFQLVCTACSCYLSEEFRKGYLPI